jgi:hypothetical protein
VWHLITPSTGIVNDDAGYLDQSSNGSHHQACPRGRPPASWHSSPGRGRSGGRSRGLAGRRRTPSWPRRFAPNVNPIAVPFPV